MNTQSTILLKGSLLGILIGFIGIVSVKAVTIDEINGKDKPLPLAEWTNTGNLLRHCADLSFRNSPCPPDVFTYNKVEGDWWVRVQQGSGNGSTIQAAYKHFIHDLTPPICKLTNEAGGNVEVTTLPGLNGKWANEGIVVYPLCYDYINTTKPNPFFCKPLNVPGRTIYHGEGIGSSISVQDLANNRGYCALESPPKVDTIDPVLSSNSIAIEHKGLGIPKEAVSPLASNGRPNKYRAHDGEVLFFLNIKDNLDTDLGTSGVSGLSFASDTGPDKSDSFTRILVTQIENEDGPISISNQKPVEVSKENDLGGGLYAFNINIIPTVGAKYPLLSQSGLYKIEAIIEDKAKNEVRSSDRYIRIYPGQVNESASELQTKTSILSGGKRGTASCTEEVDTNQALYANADHSCSIEYQLFDAFGNKLQQRTIQAITVSGQNKNGSHDLLQGAQQAFTNGLQLNKASSIVVNEEGKGVFEILALLPTVLIEQSATIQRAYNMKVASQTVVFDFEVDAVDVRGQKVGSTITIGIGTDIVFLPWLKGVLENTVEKVLLQEEQKYNVLVSTTNVEPLPNGCRVKVYGYPAPGTIFTNESFSQNEPKEFTFAAPTGSNASGVLTTRLSAAGGKIKPAGLILSSDLTCPLGGRQVTYPGGIVGDLFEDCTACDDAPILEPFAIQADIEGGVLGLVSYTDLEKSDENIREVGRNEQQDIREDITQNAFTMIRSLIPKNGISSATVTLPNTLDFSTDSIWYYKGVDVIIPSSSVNGVGTIVVEDGNIIVSGNMEYSNLKSSLGVIVINNKLKPYSETGNIYVKRDVNTFVGTYFSDGGIISYISQPGDLRTHVPADGYVIELEDIPVLVNSKTQDVQTFSDNPLARQLVLEGALLSRNTLGGDNFDPRYSPWETTEDLNLSRTYDLHFVRRYTPHRKVEYRDKNGIVTSIENLVLDDTTDRYCRKRSGVCETNKSAFVVRADRKVNTLPPPGFKVEGTLSR